MAILAFWCPHGLASMYPSSGLGRVAGTDCCLHLWSSASISGSALSHQMHNASIDECRHLVANVRTWNFLSLVIAVQTIAEFKWQHKTAISYRTLNGDLSVSSVLMEMIHHINQSLITITASHCVGSFDVIQPNLHSAPTSLCTLLWHDRLCTVKGMNVMMKPLKLLWACTWMQRHTQFPLYTKELHISCKNYVQVQILCPATFSNLYSKL